MEQKDLIALTFNPTMAASIALGVLRLSRGETLQTELDAKELMEVEKGQGLAGVFVNLFTKDDLGRRLMKEKGSGFIGAAVAMVLIALFKDIPDNIRPQLDDGKGAVHPVDMAATVLQSAIESLKITFGKNGPIEGPRRTEGESAVN